MGHYFWNARGSTAGTVYRVMQHTTALPRRSVWCSMSLVVLAWYGRAPWRLLRHAFRTRERGFSVRVLSNVAAFVLFCSYATAFVLRTSILIGSKRYFVLFDEGMISMRYAWNLSHGLGPVWNAGERVEGFTDPLWVLLMSLATFTFDKNLACLAVQIFGAALLAFGALMFSLTFEELGSGTCAQERSGSAGLRPCFEASPRLQPRRPTSPPRLRAARRNGRAARQRARRWCCRDRAVPTQSLRTRARRGGAILRRSPAVHRIPRSGLGRAFPGRVGFACDRSVARPPKRT